MPSTGFWGGFGLAAAVTRFGIFGFGFIDVAALHLGYLSAPGAFEFLPVFAVNRVGVQANQ
ncbi:protein of unknown function [Pseudomonas marincola]|uniref:Uncharacterized protein n=1 Tax=Pseudomonas marincola TaxID=437900 RepID=A0A8S2B8R1_9PSED|nr:protein of unknown function [Pseudomonas marincola]